MSQVSAAGSCGCHCPRRFLTSFPYRPSQEPLSHFDTPASAHSAHPVHDCSATRPPCCTIPPAYSIAFLHNSHLLKLSATGHTPRLPSPLQAVLLLPYQTAQVPPMPVDGTSVKWQHLSAPLPLPASTPRGQGQVVSVLAVFSGSVLLQTPYAQRKGANQSASAGSESAS